MYVCTGLPFASSFSVQRNLEIKLTMILCSSVDTSMAGPSSSPVSVHSGWRTLHVEEEEAKQELWYQIQLRFKSRSQTCKSSNQIALWPLSFPVFFCREQRVRYWNGKNTAKTLYSATVKLILWFCRVPNFTPLFTDCDLPRN